MSFAPVVKPSRSSRRISTSTRGLNLKTATQPKQVRIINFTPVEAMSAVIMDWSEALTNGPVDPMAQALDLKPLDDSLTQVYMPTPEPVIPQGSSKACSHSSSQETRKDVSISSRNGAEPAGQSKSSTRAPMHDATRELSSVLGPVGSRRLPLIDITNGTENVMRLPVTAPNRRQTASKSSSRNGTENKPVSQSKTKTKPKVAFLKPSVQPTPQQADTRHRARPKASTESNLISFQSVPASSPQPASAPPPTNVKSVSEKTSVETGSEFNNIFAFAGVTEIVEDSDKCLLSEAQVYIPIQHKSMPPSGLVGEADVSVPAIKLVVDVYPRPMERAEVYVQPRGISLPPVTELRDEARSTTSPIQARVFVPPSRSPVTKGQLRCLYLPEVVARRERDKTATDAAPSVPTRGSTPPLFGLGNNPASKVMHSKLLQRRHDHNEHHGSHTVTSSCANYNIHRQSMNGTGAPDSSTKAGLVSPESHYSSHALAYSSPSGLLSLIRRVWARASVTIGRLFLRVKSMTGPSAP